MSSFSALIVYLSTSRLHDPCTTATSPGERSVYCADPLAELPPGGVLVRRDADGFPGGFRTPKPNTTIAGHPVIETTTNNGWCASLGATETITVMIPRDTPDNWYQMDACLCAPDLSQQEAQTSALLRTVQLAAVQHSRHLVMPHWSRAP